MEMPNTEPWRGVAPQLSDIIDCVLNTLKGRTVETKEKQSSGILECYFYKYKVMFWLEGVVFRWPFPSPGAQKCRH